MLVAVAAQPLPVEVIVRGHITGVTSTSLWKRYADGERTIYGYTFPDGLQKNTELPEPIITPDHEGRGGRPRRGADVRRGHRQGLVDAGAVGPGAGGGAGGVRPRPASWPRDAGLILADTKYEFGLGPDGELLLIDEVHTPDSSRFWEAATYEERLAAGEEPESLDKEVDPPGARRRRVLAATVNRRSSTRRCGPRRPRRYIYAYERLTGATFEPGARTRQVHASKQRSAERASCERREAARRDPDGISRRPIARRQGRRRSPTALGVDVEQRIGSAHKTPDHVLAILDAYEPTRARRCT